MEYDFKIARLNLSRNLFSTIVQIICLSMGILVFALFVYQGNGTFRDTKLDKRYINSKGFNTIRPIFDSEYKGVELEDIIDENIIYMNRIESQNTFVGSELSISKNIYEVSKGFELIFNNGYLKSGSWLSSNDEVVIGENIQDIYGLNLGDEISIEGKLLKVIGILRVPKFRNSYFIGKQNKQKLFDTVLFDLDKRRDIESLGEGFQVGDGKQWITLSFKQILTGFSFSIFLSSIILLYCFFNIYHILYFYIEKNIVTFKVIMACGGKKVNIYRQKLLELCILNFYSNGIVYIILYWVYKSKYIAKRLNIHLYLSPIIVVAIFIITLAILVSIIFHKIKMIMKEERLFLHEKS